MTRKARRRAQRGKCEPYLQHAQELVALEEPAAEHCLRQRALRLAAGREQRVEHRHLLVVRGLGELAEQYLVEELAVGVVVVALERVDKVVPGPRGWLLLR
eukprot:SAG11_NODE_2233_length_3655_cov_2.314961_2_plen_101_part_00